MMRARTTLLATMATTLLFATNARAEEPPPKLVPYTVVEGDQCNTVAEKALGDARLYVLVHKYNQLGPSPHHLVPGQILMLPEQSPAARLELIRNRVEVQSKPGQLHQPLFRGNRLSTGDASAADMKFRDDTELAMGERSLVIILGATSSGVKLDTEATLVNGSLRAHLADLAGREPVPLTLATQAGDVSLGPGDLQVGVDPKQTTRLAVYKGQSSLTAQNRVVKVDQGFGSKAIEGKRPTPPAPLPPAPVWKSPNPFLTLARQLPADVSADYARGPGVGPDAAEWHVQIARDAMFHDLIADVKVPAAITRLEARRLRAGIYFARVSAIDDDHFEGPWGVTARLGVTQITLTDEANHFGLLEAPKPDLQCALDDGKPESGLDIRFDRMTPHVLRCAMTADPTLVGTIDLPREQVGAPTLKARWLTYDPMLRAGELVLQLTDPAGNPISRNDAEVSLTTPGAIIENVEPGHEPGRYFVRVRVFPGTPSFVLRLTMRGQAAETDDILAAEPPPPDVVDTGLELGVGAGAGVIGGSVAQVGPHFDVHAAFRLSLGPGDLTLGLKGLFETYPPAHVTSSSVGFSTAPGKINHNDFGVGLPVAFRFGGPDVTLRPYLAATPELISQITRLAVPSQPFVHGSGAWFGASPVVGGILQAGPGSFFFEGGYRFAWKLSSTNATVNPHGPVATVGYTFQF